MTDEHTTRRFNDYNEMTINGIRYKIHSLFEGEKDLARLLEDLIVNKAAQQKKQGNMMEETRCEEERIAV